MQSVNHEGAQKKFCKGKPQSRCIYPNKAIEKDFSAVADKALSFKLLNTNLLSVLVSVTSGLTKDLVLHNL